MNERRGNQVRMSRRYLGELGIVAGTLVAGLGGGVVANVIEKSVDTENLKEAAMIGLGITGGVSVVNPDVRRRSFLSWITISTGYLIAKAVKNDVVK